MRPTPMGHALYFSDKVASRTEKADVPGASFQFQRVGFFCVDKDSTVKAPIFNRIVPLKEGK